jgi:TRAP-type C4-dicarboxylate transport system permease small subunit
MFISNRFSAGLEILAGTALLVTMVLTGCDIVGRALGHPIPGTYEIISFAGGLVIGLAIPVTSKVRGHIIVDIVTERVSPRARFVLRVITRWMGIPLFLLMGYSIIRLANYFRVSGEVTPVLSFPFYPAAYAMGAAFFLECLVLAADTMRNGGDAHE